MHRLVQRYDRAVAKEELLDPAARRTDSDVLQRHDISGPLNYLLIGSDQRGNPGHGSGERADTILIVHIPTGLKHAYLVSVPRDLLAPIPPDPHSGYGGGADKINAAFQYGGGGPAGARLLSAAVSELTGLRFDGAAIVNFSGFRKVIDLLGGVTVCVDTDVRSIHTGQLFSAGCHEMGGGQALDYARQRYGLPDGDYDRQRHQQQIVKAIMEKAGTGKALANPVKLDQLIRTIGSAVTVDTNGVPSQDLVRALWGLRPDAVLGLRMPTASDIIDEIYYDLLDPGADELFKALQNADVESWAATNPRWVNRL
ncbi:LCP family protein [Micromonospora sp. NPDC049679]|uniref:LCP family protein n=1 Tax=Micromonospora sp. NPDC049679 TaxID=3155920 RepID=UPI003405B0F2